MLGYPTLGATQRKKDEGDDNSWKNVGEWKIVGDIAMYSIWSWLTSKKGDGVVRDITTTTMMTTVVRSALFQRGGVKGVATT
jgi:hypothetical protein